MGALTEIEEFTNYIDDFGFRHFKGSELVIGLDRGNTLPPRKLWGNIIPALKVADEARARLGFAITVNSAYRSPSYNTGVGGSPRSQHLAFKALDLAPHRAPALKLWQIIEEMDYLVVGSAPNAVDLAGIPANPLEWWRPDPAEAIHSEGGRLLHIRGGLGLYRTFVHIDTRGARARWDLA